MEVVEELAGDDVMEEFGPFTILEFPENCDPPATLDTFVTLLADLSNTDIRLLGLNFGVPLNGTGIKKDKNSIGSSNL